MCGVCNSCQRCLNSELLTASLIEEVMRGVTTFVASVANLYLNFL